MTNSHFPIGALPPLDQDPDNQAPLISIVIPFRNTEKFLHEAIESVLGQSSHNWELLLVDDGSSDRSPLIASSYVKTYPKKIRMLTHDGRRNLGVSATRNLGLSQARGRYACFLDADDVFLPDKLKEEVKILEANPEAFAVCGAYQYWYGWTGSANDVGRDFTVTLGIEAERLYQPPALLIHNLRAGGRKPGTSSIMLRRDRLSFDVCDESFKGLGDDQVFWAKLSLSAPLFVTDKCLFKYRQHSDSLCAEAMKSGEDLAAWQRFLAWLEQHLISEKVDHAEVWKALRRSQRSINYQIRFAPIKLWYRRLLPIRWRYWLRDRWINLQMLRNH